MQAVPLSAPPPYSCRSGLAVLMQGLGAQGRRESVPFKMAMKRRGGTERDDEYHVVCMKEASLEQVGAACAHRRFREAFGEAFQARVATAGWMQESSRFQAF